MHWGATQLEVVRPAANSVRAITDVLSSVIAITDLPLGLRRLFLPLSQVRFSSCNRDWTEIEQGLC